MGTTKKMNIAQIFIMIDLPFNKVPSDMENNKMNAILVWVK